MSTPEITAEQAGMHEINALRRHIESRGPCYMNDFLLHIVAALSINLPVSIVTGQAKPLEPLQVIVWIAEEDVETDDEVFRVDDLQAACPWAGCKGINEFIEDDRAERENEVLVDGPWISVQQSKDGDFHTMGWRCATCRNPVEFPDADECSPEWS